MTGKNWLDPDPVFSRVRSGHFLPGSETRVIQIDFDFAVQSWAGDLQTLQEDETNHASEVTRTNCLRELSD